MDVDDLRGRIADATPGQGAAALGAAFLVGGAYLPWIVAVGDETIRGIDGDGVFTMLFGALVVGILLFDEWRPRTALVVGGFGALALVVTGWRFLAIDAALGHDPGLGLWVSLVGAATLLSAPAFERANRE